MKGKYAENANIHANTNIEKNMEHRMETVRTVKERRRRGEERLRRRHTIREQNENSPANNKYR